VLVLPWNERYTPAHVEYLANAVRVAAEQLGTPTVPEGSAV
jgi:hypothetical protein